MKKINFKNLIILEFGILCFVLFLTDWIIAVTQDATFTVFGLITNFIYLAVANICYEYLTEYYENKKLKK